MGQGFCETGFYTLPCDWRFSQGQEPQESFGGQRRAVVNRTLLADRHYATLANAIVSVGFTPAGRQLTAT